MIIIIFITADHRRARQWIARYQRLGLGVDSGLGSAEDVQSLLDEAVTISADLSAFTDVISQANKMYCLCRAPFHSEMIGCDTCDEWFHFSCVGLSKAAAERCDRYVCVRCQLVASFEAHGVAAALLVNKWMSYADIVRAIELKQQKVYIQMLIFDICICWTLYLETYTCFNVI